MGIIALGARRHSEISSDADYACTRRVYLWGGDTLARGRLANPPHPMRRFFETMHVNMEPTYASKYPPGQAAFLALGIRHPWFGVWLSVGFLCACLCWMVQGWDPPQYGLLGGLLAAMQLGITGPWINGYWGGAIAASGGALVLGALPRLATRQTQHAAVAAAAGVFILSNSRPFRHRLIFEIRLCGTFGSGTIGYTWTVGETPFIVCIPSGGPRF